MKRDPQVNNRAVNQEEASFTLTLTPEAVELLRRSIEGNQHSVAKSTAAGSIRAAKESGSKSQSPSR
ncbi:hypothetical protein NHX12_017880 [Muraenolepis orangiensis]|uniref:Uncharacterized protein n=1 Tax=Muraenolepis orangiensis TaxID=630683 RepID=A0A9Q0IYF2_9TELE|nr:hypothetical protein NHX12_017880 [Muraenolepis orangiensis]